MLRNCALLACLALVALGTACTRTPPDTRAADIKTVKALEVAWVNDIATKDADKFASYYADDASLLLPDRPMINGRDDIKAALTPMLADPNFALTFESTQAEASRGGDFVYTIGTYAMTTTDPKTKAAVTDRGKYLTVFKKQAGGAWKAVADMTSSDAPVKTERAPLPSSHTAHRHARSRHHKAGAKRK